MDIQESLIDTVGLSNEQVSTTTITDWSTEVEAADLDNKSPYMK